MMRSSDLFCHRETELISGYRVWYNHFFTHPGTVALTYLKLPILAVTVTELPEEAPDCYWGWWDNERKRFEHIYYAAGLVQICFPAPLEDYEERGDGLLLPVSITETKELTPDEVRAYVSPTS